MSRCLNELQRTPNVFGLCHFIQFVGSIRQCVTVKQVFGRFAIQTSRSILELVLSAFVQFSASCTLFPVLGLSKFVIESKVALSV